MAGNGGIALNVLIPVVTFLSVLLVITLTLVGFVIYKTFRKPKRFGNHGVVDDYSSSWSMDGTLQGLTIREKRLLKNSRKQQSKDDGLRTTIELIKDEDKYYRATKGMNKVREEEVGGIQGRVSPGIGRAMSFGSHREPFYDHDDLPTFCDEKGELLTLDRDSQSYANLTAKHPVKAINRFQGRPEFQKSFRQTDNMHDMPSPPPSALLSQPRTSINFSMSLLTPRKSIGASPLSSPSTAFRKSTGGPDIPLRYAQSNSMVLDTEASFETFVTQLSPRTSRPVLPKIEIPIYPSVDQRPTATMKRRASSPFEMQTTPECIPELPRNLPISATHASSLSGSSPSSSWSRSNGTHIEKNETFGKATRPILNRAPSSAVGPGLLHRSTSSDVSSRCTTPKFATGPRVYSTLLPQANVTASASATSIVSMSSNSSSIITATGNTPGGLSPPPHRDMMDTSEVSVARVVRASIVGMPTPRLVRVERSSTSSLQLQRIKSFPKSVVSTVSEMPEPDAPMLTTSFTALAQTRSPSTDVYDEVSTDDDDDDDEEDDRAYTRESGSGRVYV